ncbi:UNVERIFIED_CONTAM: hypothetical protein PYX00_007673 [Menopon gallinae]|uniref:Exosome complex component CSL4 n=1 Tax=Menopon gallinae TaxID=328185 RepID=A0AAW2HJS0_9NEOP
MSNPTDCICVPGLLTVSYTIDSHVQNYIDTCISGQRICLVDKTHISGPGTFERNGYIYATLAGIVDIVKKDNVSLVTVHSFNNQSIVPAPGDIVTAKVMTVTNRFSKCEIKCVGDFQLTRTYKGILRKEDVRAADKDRTEMYKCFRPGDIILARVLPMTEPHWYHLSTAENELGVVNAYSQAGVALIPISWTEMQCPKTYVKESRKVAKILPEST